jgi:hypothetical protein
MRMKIENSASCEIWSVIKILNAKNDCPAEIYRHVCEVYGENAMSDGMVRRWCRMFSEGRLTVHDDDRSGHPSLVTADLLAQVNEKIHENRRFLTAERFNSDDVVKTALQHWVRNVGGRLLRRGDTETCAPIWQMSQFGWRLCR